MVSQTGSPRGGGGLTIGGIALEHDIMLAPMAGVTDAAFRTICGELGGCGLMFTEMVSAKGICYGDPKSFELARVTRSDGPTAVQLFGSDPAALARAIELLGDSHACFFDINMGCPMPKITKNGDGSALARDPALAYKVMKAAARAADRPVTAKIRKGWDVWNVNAVELAKRLEDAGAVMLTVHGRTRDQMYGGCADWEIIADIKRAVGIPVIGNGDVRDAESAARMTAITGCDGVMIGRAARGRPWIFRNIAAARANGQVPAGAMDITEDERPAIMRRHLDYSIAMRGERTGILEMRKHLAWYVKGMRGAAAIKDMIFHSTEYGDILRCIEELETTKKPETET